MRKTPGLIVALDVKDLATAAKLVDQLHPAVTLFKVGVQLFTAVGPRAVEAVQQRGGQVFLDLKLHDIPNTVAGAVREAARMGAVMCTLHASGGLEMMRAARAAADELPQPDRPMLLGVTVLTSFSSDLWAKTFPGDDIGAAVARLAAAAGEAGLQGLVCSALELEQLDRIRLTKVVPGIRPSGNMADDQSRIMTPAKAIAAGADYLVVGRPILRAAEPLSAALRILEEIRAAVVSE